MKIDLTAMTAAVELRSISKHFGEGAARADALRDVSLDIHAAPLSACTARADPARARGSTSSDAFSNPIPAA